MGAQNVKPSNKTMVDRLVEEQGYIRSAKVEGVFRAVDRAMYYEIEDDDTIDPYDDGPWRRGKLHLSAPCIYAKVVEALDLHSGMSFLNLGSGTGYLNTIVGLLIGPNGINHGVELHKDVVEYAHKKLQQFKERSCAIDKYDFSEPSFIRGNCINLDPNIRYDRIYLGAACLPDMEMFMKKLIKVNGGILVMPYENHLMRHLRLSETEWQSEKLMDVNFTLMIGRNNHFVGMHNYNNGGEVDDYDDEKMIELPKETAKTLKELCRIVIRQQLRHKTNSMNPNLLNSDNYNRRRHRREMATLAMRRREQQRQQAKMDALSHQQQQQQHQQQQRQPTRSRLAPSSCQLQTMCKKCHTKRLLARKKRCHLCCCDCCKRPERVVQAVAPETGGEGGSSRASSNLGPASESHRMATRSTSDRLRAGHQSSKSADVSRAPNAATNCDDEIEASYNESSSEQADEEVMEEEEEEDDDDDEFNADDAGNDNGSDGDNDDGGDSDDYLNPDVVIPIRPERIDEILNLTPWPIAQYLRMQHSQRMRARSSEERLDRARRFLDEQAEFLRDDDGDQLDDGASNSSNLEDDDHDHDQDDDALEDDDDDGANSGEESNDLSNAQRSILDMIRGSNSRNNRDEGDLDEEDEDDDDVDHDDEVNSSDSGGWQEFSPSEDSYAPNLLSIDLDTFELRPLRQDRPTSGQARADHLDSEPISSRLRSKRIHLEETSESQSRPDAADQLRATRRASRSESSQPAPSHLCRHLRRAASKPNASASDEAQIWRHRGRHHHHHHLHHNHHHHDYHCHPVPLQQPGEGRRGRIANSWSVASLNRLHRGRLVEEVDSDRMSELSSSASTRREFVRLPDAASLSLDDDHLRRSQLSSTPFHGHRAAAAGCTSRNALGLGSVGEPLDSVRRCGASRRVMRSVPGGDDQVSAALSLDERTASALTGRVCPLGAMGLGDYVGEQTDGRGGDDDDDNDEDDDDDDDDGQESGEGGSEQRQGRLDALALDQANGDELLPAGVGASFLRGRRRRAVASPGPGRSCRRHLSPRQSVDTQAASTRRQAQLPLSTPPTTSSSGARANLAAAAATTQPVSVVRRELGPNRIQPLERKRKRQSSSESSEFGGVAAARPAAGEFSPMSNVAAGGRHESSTLAAAVMATGSTNDVVHQRHLRGSGGDQAGGQPTSSSRRSCCCCMRIDAAATTTTSAHEFATSRSSSSGSSVSTCGSSPPPTSARRQALQRARPAASTRFLPPLIRQIYGNQMAGGDDDNNNNNSDRLRASEASQQSRAAYGGGGSTSLTISRGGVQSTITTRIIMLNPDGRDLLGDGAELVGLTAELARPQRDSSQWRPGTSRGLGAGLRGGQNWSDLTITCSAGHSSSNARSEANDELSGAERSPLWRSAPTSNPLGGNSSNQARARRTTTTSGQIDQAPDADCGRLQAGGRPASVCPFAWHRRHHCRRHHLHHHHYHHHHHHHHHHHSRNHHHQCRRNHHHLNQRQQTSERQREFMTRRRVKREQRLRRTSGEFPAGQLGNCQAGAERRRAGQARGAANRNKRRENECEKYRAHISGYIRRLPLPVVLRDYLNFGRES